MVVLRGGLIGKTGAVESRVEKDWRRWLVECIGILPLRQAQGQDDSKDKDKCNSDGNSDGVVGSVDGNAWK